MSETSFNDVWDFYYIRFKFFDLLELVVMKMCLNIFQVYSILPYPIAQTSV